MSSPAPRPTPDVSKAQAWQQHYSQAPVVQRYQGNERLQPPEAAIVAALRGQLADARLLDVGVGGGRTTVHLASACRAYTAIDFAPTMVAACRERFRHAPWFTDDSIRQGDVRELAFDDAAFDVVLFSFNGIDYVSRAERMQALAQCRRVLRAGGVFVYSSHNLNWVDGSGRLPRRGGWRDWLGDHQYRRQMLRLNGSTAELAARDETELREPPDGLSVYYARPAEHLRQARAAGFGALRVFDSLGVDVTADPRLDRLRDPWLYFMGTAVAA